MGEPFVVSGELSRGTDAVVAHEEKFALLARVANQISGMIADDEKELDSTGFTEATMSRSFAALFETLVAEQYSMLDGLRRAVFGVFGGVRGFQNKKTSLFFRRATDGQYQRPPAGHLGESFFADLISGLAAADATWFPLLREIRVRTTHGDVGSCYRDGATGKTSYRHWRGQSVGKHVSIDDAISWMNNVHSKSFGLAKSFFDACFALLEPTEHEIACGMFQGRAYMRFVRPSSSLSFDDGRCLSRGWFEKEPGLECPMCGKCGAHNRPVPDAERSAYYSR